MGEAGGPRGEGREEAGGMGLMVWTDVGMCACAQERETGRITVQVSEGGEGRRGRGVVRVCGAVTACREVSEDTGGLPIVSDFVVVCQGRFFPAIP